MGTRHLAKGGGGGAGVTDGSRSGNLRSGAKTARENVQETMAIHRRSLMIVLFRVQEAFAGPVNPRAAQSAPLPVDRKSASDSIIRIAPTLHSNQRRVCTTDGFGEYPWAGSPVRDG